MKADRHTTVFRIFLIFLMVFQALSGLLGGLALTIDPQGNMIKMPLTLLEKSPFSSFLIPGLILLIVLGIGPALCVCSLIFRPSWKWASRLNIHKETFWGWTYSLCTGIILIIWIDVEHLMIQTYTFLQPLYSLIGVLIIICCLIPSVKDYYKAGVYSDQLDFNQ